MGSAGGGWGSSLGRFGGAPLTRQRLLSLQHAGGPESSGPETPPAVSHIHGAGAPPGQSYLPRNSPGHFPGARACGTWKIQSPRCSRSSNKSLISFLFPVKNNLERLQGSESQGPRARGDLATEKWQCSLRARKQTCTSKVFVLSVHPLT